MQVDALPLSQQHREHLLGQGIEELYPPQAAAVEAGVCEGESVLAAVPTASGKTLIAQLAMLTADGPAVYVVPLRALATEKAATFGDLPGVSVGVATGDFDGTDEELAEHDVVVATAEKVDAAIRHGAAWVQRIDCAVVDEVHLLDDDARGPTLEVTIAKLRRLNPDVQLVALSATVPNADAVADWLDAAVVHSEWRPVDLRRGIDAEGHVAWEDGELAGSGSDEADCSGGAEDVVGDEDSEEYGDDGEEDSDGEGDSDGESYGDGDEDDRSATGRLVTETLADGGQGLVFVSSRRDARQLASELAGVLDALLLPDRGESTARADDADSAENATQPPNDQDATALANGGAEEPSIAAALRETAATPTGEALADVAADGVAFHHAGLRGEHRQIVEQGFRNGELGVLCATPTLAAGVNVPARRVLVRDHERYGDDGYEPLSTLEAHQMFGRAGRPGLDPYGEAILLADDAGERAELADRYLAGEPEPVTSALDDPSALRPHVLASIAAGMVTAVDDLEALLAETFCAHVGDAEALCATADAALDRLHDAGMIERADDGSLAATELGALVSQVYVDPVTGADVVAALDRADDLDRISALTVCELICDTAEMPARYVRNDEAGELSAFAMRHEDELAKSVRDFDGEFHDWLASLKTARLLADYADGVALSELVEAYSVGPGDVRRYAERAEWLLSATGSIAEHADSEATDRIRETRERLSERTA